MRRLTTAVFASTMIVAGAAEAADPQTIPIGYIRWSEPLLTLSPAGRAPEDDGIAGAELGIRDNNTTGKFTKQEFTLQVKEANSPETARAAMEALRAEGIAFVLADLPADALLSISDPAATDSHLIFNVSANDDALRGDACRADIIHTAASHAQLADGLAQYLVWKKWNRWFLLSGALPADAKWAEALKRSARKFGAEIVEERVYAETDTARRTDSGHAQVQRQIPVFTQNAPEHDVVVVADESEIFGTYVPFRTWTPRPVAGSAGLVPTGWDANAEQWGGMQLQSRFAKGEIRQMREKDMDAWTAVRIIGEAATRTKSADPATLKDYMLGPKMEIAAFKGEKLTIRPWDHQLRQPILLTDRASIVSVSPQEGFLHQKTELDTLGIDQPETACRF